MSRDPLTIVVAVALVLYGLYIGAFIPPLLVGSPATIILLGFVAQTIAALAGAIGAWWRQPWAPAVIVSLGVAIAVTALVEGFVLGLVAYNYALGVAVIGLGVTIAMAIYVSRARVGTRLRPIA